MFPAIKSWQMRKLAASILALALLVLSAVPALGAVDQEKLKEIKALTQQMNSIKVQIIDKEVEAGILDQTKADKIKTPCKNVRRELNKISTKANSMVLGTKKAAAVKTLKLKKQSKLIHL